jgi:hypothetical protein
VGFWQAKYLKAFADGQFTGGSDGARQGWGFALRLTF